MFDAPAYTIARAVRDAKGHAFFVGGWVRDRVLGIEAKDIDIEVYGLSLDKLESLLGRFGEVHAVGKSFGVLKVAGMDVSVPRRESKTGKGHRGFLMEPDPTMSFADACRRRDFTMNAMLFDPITEQIVDPFNGLLDLRGKLLRMTDPASFIEDPLRVLRAAQFLARFELDPDPLLVATSRSIRETLRELAAERIFDEWAKLLLKGRKPSRGMQFLHDVGAHEILFPEIATMVGCQQELEWHPEGDVFVHTGMVIDEAAKLRTGEAAHDLPLMFGALCHDFGKPPTTKFEDGRWRSRGHEDAGLDPSRAFLERMRAPAELVTQVLALVKDHLAPSHFQRNGAGPKAFRRLAKSLADAGTSIEMLHKVATADHFGRTTPDAIAREFPAGDAFLANARAIAVEKEAEQDVVLGRHLIARGMKPGPEFGPILERCRELQYETGLKDPEEILRKALG